MQVTCVYEHAHSELAGALFSCLAEIAVASAAPADPMVPASPVSPSDSSHHALPHQESSVLMLARDLCVSRAFPVQTGTLLTSLGDVVRRILVCSRNEQRRGGRCDARSYQTCYAPPLLLCLLQHHRRRRVVSHTLPNASSGPIQPPPFHPPALPCPSLLPLVALIRHPSPPLPFILF